MPGIVWTESELVALRKYVAQGMTARVMKSNGCFARAGAEGSPVDRSSMSIQKQMQRLQLADPVRSEMVRADKAGAWTDKDREDCVRDLMVHWRETPVERFAERWGGSPATIKYILKRKGLGLSWKEAIQLKDSPFRNPEKRREWAETYRSNARVRREQRRAELVRLASAELRSGDSAQAQRRRCVDCQQVFPLRAGFFRTTRHQGKVYYSHVCVVCSCDRNSRRAEPEENLMVRRNRERLLRLRDRLLASQSVDERICWKCSRSWPLDKRFFKYSRSRADGRVLFEHVCRLCRAARRRALARRAV